jgi:Aldo/keto reductase family
MHPSHHAVYDPAGISQTLLGQWLGLRQPQVSRLIRPQGVAYLPGLKVSRICLGMMSYGDRQWCEWVLDEGQAEPIVRRAVERGVIFFDTAHVYSDGVSEEITGRLLGKFFARRDDYVLATKVNSPMGTGLMTVGFHESTSLALSSAHSDPNPRVVVRHGW